MPGLRGSVRLSAALVAATLGAATAVADEVRVFAAASLTEALDAALAVCDPQAIGVYAGSGTAARQIEQGAPAALYISANPQWMDWLEKRGRIVSETRVDLLGNALVLVAPRDQLSTKPTTDGVPPDLPALLSDSRVAIADPEAVPAGIYAKQAMERNGWWADERLRKALIPGASVREALSWVARGDAGYGFVYRTDALREARVTVMMTFGPDAHDPIRYPAAVIADEDSPNARRLLTCLMGEEASGVFKRYGFEPLSD